MTYLYLLTLLLSRVIRKRRRKMERWLEISASVQRAFEREI